MEDITTIRIRKTDRDLLDKLRGRDNISSQINYFEAMVNYFDSTGLNPEEKIKSTAGELSKLRNTVVSFIRTQEEKKLDPMMKAVDELTNTLLTFLKTEALKKQEFLDYMDSQKVDTNPVVESDSGKKANELFVEFVSKMKSGLGGGYSIDKKTLNHYKNQFAAL